MTNQIATLTKIRNVLSSKTVKNDRTGLLVLKPLFNFGIGFGFLWTKVE